MSRKPRNKSKTKFEVCKILFQNLNEDKKANLRTIKLRLPKSSSVEYTYKEHWTCQAFNSRGC